MLAQQNVADAAAPQELTFSIPSAGYQATLWDNTANTRLTPSGWYQTGVYTLQDTIPETRTVVACVGDSLTEGQGAIDGMLGLTNQYIWAYPNQLQRMLGGDYDVKGFGVGGRCVLSTGTSPYVNEDAFTLSKQCNPDIVIVMLGTNDIGELINDESKQETFCQEYKALVQSYQNTDKQPVVYLVVPPLKRSAQGSAANSKIAAFMQPAILQVAKELGCRAVALNTLVAEEDFTPRDDLMKDDTHYTTFGYQEFAKVLSDAIKGQDSSLTLDDTTEGKCVVSARTPLEASVFTAAHKNDFLQELKPLTINGRMPVGRFALEPEADADRWQVLAWKSMGSLEPMEGITAKRDGSGIKTEGAEAKVYGTVKPGKIVDVAVKNAEGTAILLKSQAANNAGYYEVNLGSAYQNGCKVYVNGVAQN